MDTILQWSLIKPLNNSVPLIIIIITLYQNMKCTGEPLCECTYVCSHLEYIRVCMCVFSPKVCTCVCVFSPRVCMCVCSHLEYIRVCMCVFSPRVYTCVCVCVCSHRASLVSGISLSNGILSLRNWLKPLFKNPFFSSSFSASLLASKL